MRFRLPLGEAIHNLAQRGRRLSELFQPGHAPVPPKRAKSALANAGKIEEITDFAPNPGALRMFSYVPARLAKKAPLVVVLHGCTQSASGYDHGSGWSVLAERHGFALLFAEQQRQNNNHLCLNWFEPGDITRGQGEAASIAAMIETLASRHALDRKRVFVTGLSAGGAMSSVMLATYPELFAGAGIIAGLPYGAATSMREALAAMRGIPVETGAHWAEKVRKASKHDGPWPVVSVWHGTKDHVVSPTNATAIVRQWTTLQGLGERDYLEFEGGAARRRLWKDAQGRPVVEFVRIEGLDHAAPIDPQGRSGAALGIVSPFFTDAGLCATSEMARFWGIGA